MPKIKILSILLLGLATAACTNTTSNNHGHSAHQMPAYHTGKITPSELLNQYSIFAEHKKDNENAATDAEVAALAKQLDNKKLVVVFGTWCHDSQREVPRLLNLLDRVKSAHPQVKFDTQFIAAAPYELRDKALIKKYSLTAVPTIMLFDQDQELGRIVETTTAPSLALDMVRMKL